MGSKLQAATHSNTKAVVNIEILYEDEYLLVVNKPAGILVHKTAIDFHEEQNLLSLLKNQLGKWLYPAHRLDKPTSGLLVLAFNQETASKLGQLFASRSMQKEYLALVRGYVKVSGMINSPLNRLIDSGAMQDAMTEYEPIKNFEHPFPVRPYATARYSLLKVMPKTGRQHQIRRHLKHIFHPIIGDTCYGDGKHNQHCRKHFACKRLMLHASRLHFVHPYTGEQLALKAPKPPCFDQIVSLLTPWCTPII